MKELISICEKYELNISDNQCQQFKDYFDLLVEWNSFMNLTSITEKNEVMIKHFLDSIICSKYYDFSNKNLIDVGTGAGFPGIPLKIFNPELSVTLLDSLNKRINFLDAVIDKLSLKDIITVHSRAEDGAHNELFRENFDIAVSRAVANLSVLSEYCLPFVKIGGVFISYKSGDSEEEINLSKNSIKILGGKINKVESYSIMDNVSHEILGRSLVIIDKIDKCKNNYPRKAGTPAKNPL